MRVGVDKARQDAANEHAKSVIQKALKRAFAPEFLNRIDDVVLFNTLSREDIHKIINIELEKLFGRIKGLGYNLNLTKKAKDYIADKGFDKQYGARPLKRAIQKYIEDALAEEIIRSSIHEGDKITVEYDEKNSEIKIKIKHKRSKSKKEEG